jgi:hypothetical protein
LYQCNRNISPEVDFECLGVALAEALTIDGGREKLARYEKPLPAGGEAFRYS